MPQHTTPIPASRRAGENWGVPPVSLPAQIAIGRPAGFATHSTIRIRANRLGIGQRLVDAFNLAEDRLRDFLRLVFSLGLGWFRFGLGLEVRLTFGVE